MSDEEMVCDACNGKEFTELGWLGKIQYLRCKSCGQDVALSFSLEEATPPPDDEADTDVRLLSIPDYGSHMPWDKFVEIVKDGGFDDDDGHADLATATQVSEQAVNPSDILDGFEKPPWATHVVWYNR